MVKQEVIDGLKALRENAVMMRNFTKTDLFTRDIKVLERAIEIIDKCIPVLKCKGVAHEGIEEDSTCKGCFNQRSCWCDDCNEYSNLNAQ